MSSPAIILTSQFTVGSNFEGYIKYMRREEAQQPTTKLLIEEAESLLKQDMFTSLITKYPDLSFDRYIDYMKRKQALEQKPKLTPEEQARYEYLSTRLADVWPESSPADNSSNENNPGHLNTGLFNEVSYDVSPKEANAIQQEFKQAGNKGHVLFQDVFSFDTKELIALGIYNPVTEELQRGPLIEATRRAMASMFQNEKLTNTGFWVGEIHYNTDHFHVHVATSEYENSRPIKQFTLSNGQTVRQPKGTRKVATFDRMKTSFMNQLVDRSHVLEQLSTLRNTLVTQLREETELQSNTQSLTQLKKELTVGKKWTYKNLTTDQRSVVDNLVAHYMKDNQRYQEYQDLLREEGSYRNALYTKADKNDYYTNQFQEMKKRLGNALLKNLKQTDLIAASEDTRPLDVSEKNQMTTSDNPSTPVSQTHNIGKYSDINQRQIYQQFSEATLVHSTYQWRTKNREVLPGAIPILVSRPVLDDDQKVTRYEAFEIFDISQTRQRTPRAYVASSYLQQQANQKIIGGEIQFTDHSKSSGKRPQLEPNIQDFSKMNQQIARVKVPNVSTIHDEIQWMKLGCVVDEDAQGFNMNLPVYDTTGERHIGFTRAVYYDSSQVTIATKEQRKDIEQYLKKNGLKYGTSYSEDVATFVKGGNRGRAFKLDNLFKDALNNEWERQQQLREHERMAAHIQYIKKAIEQGYDI